MKKLIFFLISLIGFAINGIAYSAITDPSALDQKAGDTVIYGGGSTAALQPNVLIIFDNSGSMSGNANPSSPYNRTTTYTVTNSCEGDTQPCDSAWVYRLVAQGVEGKWVKHILLSSVYNSGGNNCRTTLNNTGQYQGRLSGATGQCGSGTNSTYATGNWINWLNTPGTQAYPKIEVAKKVVRNLIQSTAGVKFGLMNFNNNQGGYIAFPVSDMTLNACSGTNCDYLDENATATAVGTNQKALLDIIGDPGQDLPSSAGYNDLYSYSDDNPSGIQPSTWTPLGETLFEAMRYYSGGAKVNPNNNYNGTTWGNHTSPIEYSCQKNYVIIITDGMSTQDRGSELTTICNSGDCDNDGPEVTTQGSNGSDYLDDVAWYMYNTDLLPDSADAKTTGKQNVITYTIGFGLTGADADAVTLLQNTANNGGGTAYLASDISTLSSALTQIFANIMAANTSFVSPVVPVNPENKVYSGERVYIGFFKPSTTGFWGGNVKKYGLRENSSGDLEITDKDGNLATNSDGSFRDNSTSFWGTAVDGGQVEAGGVGIQLYNRTTARNIYTYLGANSDLTNSVNAFTTANTNITYSILGVADNTEKDKLINYVHGEDSYSNPGAKRDWILGDVLHSKPLVVQYAKYTFNSSNEASCSTNKTIIYVGANDGMLHAFRDCDGSELWAFIPPDKLGHLRYLNGSTHTYFVDGTPKAYIYDKNKDGNISATDDKVIMIFGERRGGQYYYALDVTDSTKPKYLWRISKDGLLKAGSASIEAGSGSWFTEMWETFSDPIIDKIQLSSSDKRIAMFIGAGYDNNNQDLEPPSIAGADTKGRGVYVIEIGKITGSGLDLANSGMKLWGYTNANNSAMTNSIPSTVTAIDADDNSYIDRLYVGDTGGKVWRLDVKGSTSDWKGRLLFSSNTGSSEKRKIFYEPAVTYESDSNNRPFEMVFFGTGDREHPVRTNKDNATNPIQIDRMYGVKDKAPLYTITESYLTDVTEDRLQEAPGTSTSEINCLLSRLGWGASVTGCDEQDGWYIKLNELKTDGSLREEKVLAAATIFSGGAYYTTYSPETDTGTTTDVCTAGKEGTARLYAVHWRTGEAIMNADTTNDSTSTTNERAINSDNKILLRSDRSLGIGSGIPSKPATVCMGNDCSMLIGVGGKISTIKPKDPDKTNVIYWRELF